MNYKIPYGKQNIDEKDLAAVTEALQSDFLTQGPRITAFEDAFAKYVGAKYAVAVNNATSGLHIAVKALGLKKGERVITTPVTFAASANCARFEGAEVWFADIDPDTYLLSFEKTKALIESKPAGFFTGIIPVDFGGLPVDLEKFKELARQHDLWIIEDACHAPGGYFTDTASKEIRCGSGIYADCAVFSFHPVKHIACGEGGMVTTNSEEVYQKLKLYRTHGITKENMSSSDGGWYYEMQELGYNYRLTDFQAALGLTQLGKNPAGVVRRNEIADKYRQALEGTVKCQFVPSSAYHAYHLFVIETENRKELYDFLHQNGIFAQIHYIPLHKLPYYKEIGYGDADLSAAENYYSQCISLPMYPTLTNEEQDYVISKVLEYVRR
ncbi:MAG: UDP-4-keto-6-deoxy-N-acetylglucosamine 4-aminotransferase [Crocinitomicaceae bacterium]|jgi:UDP-4-amino-4,6-dideoxy-N-acetyl-beta-L-altrosamine transaminase|nr:UDP-4-keto-6-deoxy-N-acetylglucosamine 4-aminotransferase [Crocinitomicaceae bacterium]